MACIVLSMMQLLSSELSQVAIHLVHLEARALKRAFLEGDLADSMLDAYPDGVYGWLHRNAMSKNVPIMFSTESFTSMHVEMLPAAQQISHESLEEYNLQASADFDLLSYAVGETKLRSNAPQYGLSLMLGMPLAGHLLMLQLVLSMAS